MKNTKQIVLNCRSKRETDFMVKWCIKGLAKYRKRSGYENKIADILKKSLIEAGQRKSFFEGTYVKLNSDTFKWFISQAEAALLAHFKSLLPKRKLHKHDSIPSYTSEVENGCIECIKNQFLYDIERNIEGEG